MCKTIYETNRMKKGIPETKTKHEVGIEKFI